MTDLLCSHLLGADGIRHGVLVSAVQIPMDQGRHFDEEKLNNYTHYVPSECTAALARAVA